MAIQILQQPPQISFSGDPIIVKAKTTLTGKTFLRIKLTVNATAYSSIGEKTYSENYSYEVGNDGLATFNIGETIKMAMESSVSIIVSKNTILPVYYAVKYTLTYKESYLDGIKEIEEGEMTSEQYSAVTGSLTEYERMIAANADTTTIIGEGRILSRKPEGDMVPKGIGLLLPAVDAYKENISYVIEQGDVRKELSASSGGALIPSSININTSDLQEGEFKVSTDRETGKKRYIVKQNPNMRHFLFVNGFGMLESVTAVTRESLSYDIQSDLYSVPQDIDFRGTTQVINYAQAPNAVFGMSSGYVTREWAEWWLSEFVVTRKAWMLDGGIYLPVAIIPEETNDLIDRSKPGLLSVNFSVRYSFTGGRYNSFIS